MIRQTVIQWADLPDCAAAFDEWSEEYVWPCMLVAISPMGNYYPPDWKGELLRNQHSLHHDQHPAQLLDWSIGILPSPSGPYCMCSHEGRDESDLF